MDDKPEALDLAAAIQRARLESGERAQAKSLGTDAMGEKAEIPPAPKPDLAAAIQRARLESGERAKAKGSGIDAMEEKAEIPPAPKPDLAAAIQRARLENERAKAKGLGIDAMNEKPEIPHAAKPDLAAAVRRARVENAERAEAIAELREIEVGRLALLESELKPVVRQAPPGVDLFDLTLSPGERPRLFLDMVAFVEMGRDRRTYRFFQDTLHGRVLIAESQQIERIVAAATNYVARRLVERERALAAESGDDNRQPTVWPTRQGAPAAERVPRRPQPPEAKAAAQAPVAAFREPASSETTLGQRVGDVFAFLLMTLGSVTLICLLALGGYFAWTMRLRALWAHWFGLPPF
jgi:hypothetical protein